MRKIKNKIASQKYKTENLCNELITCVDKSNGVDMTATVTVCKKADGTFEVKKIRFK